MGPAPRQRPGMNQRIERQIESTGMIDTELMSIGRRGSKIDEGIARVICLCLAAAGAEDRPCVVIVVGAPGTPEYAAQFQPIGRTLAGRRSQGRGGIDLDRPVEAQPAQPIVIDCGRSWRKRPRVTPEPLWIVLIGHGTYDGREAKFNLRGPDVTDLELSEWLAPSRGRSSSSTVPRRAAHSSIVSRATTAWSSRRPRAGNEMNFARFGQYLAEAIADRPCRPRQGRPGLAFGGIPDRQQPGRGVLSYSFATGHRARAPGR